MKRGLDAHDCTEALVRERQVRRVHLDERRRRHATSSYLQLIATYVDPRDPAIVAIRAFLASRGPVAPEARIVVNRYLVGRDSYQNVSPVMQRLHEILNHDLHMLAPDVRSSFNVYGEPEIWAPANLFAQCERLDGFDFDLGNRRFGIFGHCWQDVPLRAWADAIISKLVAGATP